MGLVRRIGGARRHRRPVDARRRARATAFIRLARVREGPDAVWPVAQSVFLGQTLTSTKGGSSGCRLARAASTAAAFAWSTA